ncbi:hypothetical protein O3M35_013230 [Rhynocoris fuscipes]|uniref:Uncharacterized protein n=1 Tax=Rhynocoris fuscipes TaxID=488301 RepID=A0AAW1CEL2_9HEMI
MSYSKLTKFSPLRHIRIRPYQLSILGPYSDVIIFLSITPHLTSNHHITYHMFND